MSEPFGRFQVAITPLLRADSTWGEEAYIYATQFSDVNFQHNMNEGRTASVTLSMYDSLVGIVAPYSQALSIWYIRPGEDNRERIFWGTCNVIEDYAAGTVTLDGQDPSIMLQHHYLRIDDLALNNPQDNKKGNIPLDGRGIALLVSAGNPGTLPLVLDAVGIPLLGLTTHNHMANRAVIRLEVERGQEIWATITDIVEGVAGPDIDLKPNQGLNGGLPSGATSQGFGLGRCYAVLHSYDPWGGATVLGRDLGAVIHFEYGLAQDNASNVRISPTRPGNDAVAVDNSQTWRVRAVADTERQITGLWQDWIMYDHRVGWGDVEPLAELAQANCKLYARPLRQCDLELRHDVGQDYFYGDPDALGISETGDFYVGDIVTVSATKGARSVSEDYRVVGVNLSMQGTRGPIITKLTLVPDVEGIEISLDYAFTPTGGGN